MMGQAWGCLPQGEGKQVPTTSFKFVTKAGVTLQYHTHVEQKTVQNVFRAAPFKYECTPETV